MTFTSSNYRSRQRQLLADLEKGNLDIEARYATEKKSAPTAFKQFRRPCSKRITRERLMNPNIIIITFQFHCDGIKNPFFMNILNILVYSSWPAYTKIDRKRMVSLLEHIIEIMSPLENGIKLMNPYNEEVEVRVYVFISPVDKPALCKVQNHKQFNSGYGCGICEQSGTKEDCELLPCNIAPPNILETKENEIQELIRSIREVTGASNDMISVMMEEYNYDSNEVALKLME
ncbi:unnamed protein product, partial [Didymodactylos carnosus]